MLSAGLVLILGPSPRVFGQSNLVLDPALDLVVLDGVAVRGDDVAPLTGGRLLVAGYFEKVDGVTRPTLARLNADGSLDASFTPAEITGFRAASCLDASGRDLHRRREGVAIVEVYDLE